MSRSCGWCSASSELRSAWEGRVLNGESISLVATETPYSASAAKRHVRLHLNPAQQLAMRTLDSATLHVHDLAARMVALANEASELRSETTDPRTKLQSIREEHSVLSSLTGQLGIESTESVEVVREARALAIALSTVLADEPTVAAALSRELVARGEHDLGRAFSRLSDDASARHVRQLARTRPAQEVGA